MKKFLLFLMFAMFCIPWAANAQTTVEIGDLETATNDSYLPMNSLYEYSYSQQIYTADEIGTAGTITAITIWLYGNADLYEIPFDIYMVETDKESFTSTSDWAAVTSGDIVYSGSVTVHNTEAQAYTFTLTRPFTYSGTGNLLIAFDNNCGQWKSGLNGKVFAATDGVNRSIYARRDSQDYDPTNMSSISANGLLATRNVIEIDITPSSGPTCERPDNFEVSNITGYDATCTWTSEVGNYTFEYKKASESDWTVVTGLTATTYTLNNLDPFTTYNTRVKAVCGPDLESSYKTANFTTLEVCPDGKICIGQGTATNSYLPTYNYFNYSLTEQIYTAEEIGQAGAILSLDIYSVGTVTRNLEFYMVSTTKETFADGTDWIAATASDLVYNGSVTFAANSWNTITLDDPFIYDGNSNVALIVRDMTGSYESSINFFVFDAPSQAIRIYRDGSPYDLAAPGEGTVMNVKNRVRLVVGEPPACPKPTGLAVNYTGGTEATISWTSDAENFSLQYYNDFDESEEIEVTGNSYTLTGLELATTYGVMVKANCGDAESEWTNPVSFTTDACMPEDMCELTITLTDAYGDGGGNIQVVDVLTNEVLGSFTNSGESTTYTLAVCDGRELNFVYASTDSWSYENGWVITDINNEIISEHVGCSSSGSCDAPTNGVIANYTMSCTVTTCRRPTNLAASEVGPRSAVLSWTENGEATAWVVEYTDLTGGGVVYTYENVSNPYTLVGLFPESEYSVRVRPICSDFDDKWSEPLKFTTTEPCPAPTDLEATHVTATSATLNWEGWGSQYNVRYGVMAHGEVLAEQNFDDSSMGDWTTIDADGDGYEWMIATESPGVYHNEGAEFSGQGHESSADFVVSGSYTNIGSVALTPDNYWVSPQVEVGGSISFWAQAQDVNYPAEHFGVAVSTLGNTDDADFTTIWEQTMTAKGGNDRGNAARFVVDAVRTNPSATRSGESLRAGTWYHFTVDLSEYSGLGYVAIRHFNCSDQFVLNVDDIVIEGPAQMQWTELTVSDDYVDISGLEAETEYTWQVQANCGDDGMGAWTSYATFTTGNFCETPHELEATDVNYNAATLNWYGSQDSYNVRYRTAEVIEEVYFYDFNDGYNAAHADGWNWEGNIIYGFDDPIYGIDGDNNYFLQMGWATTNETYIFSPELLEYADGSVLEFYYFGYSVANTFQVGYSSTTNDTLAFAWSEPIDAPLSSYTLFSEVLPAGTKYVAFKATATSQSACIFIDDFRVYSIVVPAGEWIEATANESTLAISGLTPETDYEWQVQGINPDCEGLEWSEMATFFNPIPFQSIALVEGFNWVSFNVDITLDDLKAALLEALPGATSITISAKNQNTTYNGSTWRGSLRALDVRQMYKIKVASACSIELTGEPLNPAELTIDMVAGNTWIGFPFSESKALADAFAGFAVSGDKITSKNGNATCIGNNRWRGSLNTLVPGQGYIYKSATGGTFVYPTGSSK